MIKIGNKHYQTGDILRFEVNRYPSDTPITYEDEILAVAGGGFYGTVLIFEDYVVKTAQPDAWHHLWRMLNFRSPLFPPQAEEASARLDHLSMQIIHLIVPHYTKGELVAPASSGYTWLDGLGYAQVIERMIGHGVRFDVEGQNDRLNAMRDTIWDLGVEMGIEHAAQVHPKNPFGKPNIWIGQDELFIWLDTLPAIPHTGFVLPAFYFAFHKEVREKIGDGELTFNRIHTDRIRKTLKNRPELFADLDTDLLHSYIEEYDRTYQVYEKDIQEPIRKRVADDLQRRGQLTDSQATAIQNAGIKYVFRYFGIIVVLILRSIWQMMYDRWFIKVFVDEEYRRKVIRFIFDNRYRRHKIIKETMMRGITKALENNVLTLEENEALWEQLREWAFHKDTRRLMAGYFVLQVAFIVSGLFINSVSVIVFGSAFFREDTLQWILMAFVIDWVVPPLIRVILVLIAWKFIRKDLRVLLKVSLIPKLGSYLAVAADLNTRFGSQSEMIWHYNKRYFSASLSKLLRPWGGWNSDLEERIWQWFQFERW
jgi:hypothetical protein